MKTDKFLLLNAFANGLPFTLPDGTQITINSIEREDGSNWLYNVTGYTRSGVIITLFVDTRP
jgi:hypothetical protein